MALTLSSSVAFEAQRDGTRVKTRKKSQTGLGWPGSRRLLRLAGALGTVLALANPARLAAEDSPGADYGPAYSSFALTLQKGERRQWAGPLFATERNENEEGWTFSPLMSHRHDKGTDRSEFDFAYPLLTYDRFGPEYRFQFFQLFALSGGSTLDKESKSRFTLFPFVFSQRSKENPKLNYFGLFPVYGHLENHFFRDEVNFALFPAYVQTRKKDLVTWNYMAPFFHYREGTGLKGWQFWPVVGKEHKEVTTRTNIADQVETVGGHDKFFALWPLYFNNDLGIGTTNAQTQRVLLPFYSVQKSPARDSSTYFFPFGYTTTVDREKKYREWGAPWPLVIRARGEGKTADRIWPLFGRAHNDVLESDFYLWPLYKYNRAHSEPLDRERTRILFYLYSDLIEKNTGTKTSFHRTDLWPLFTARKEHNGNHRMQFPAPLEIFLPNNKSIEQTYSPAWTLWLSEQNPKTGAKTDSFLWNTFRRERAPGREKVSVLFGLFHYDRTEEGTKWKAFYVPWKTGSKASHSPAEKAGK